MDRPLYMRGMSICFFIDSGQRIFRKDFTLVWYIVLYSFFIRSLRKDMLVRGCGKALKDKDAASVLGVEDAPFQKTTVRKKFMRYRFKLDEKKMVQRKCLSEPPFFGVGI